MPWSAMICPKGYFLAELKYHFTVPGTGQDEKQPPFAANPFNENLPKPPRGAKPPANMQPVPPDMQGMPPNMQDMPPNMQGMPPNMQGMPPNIQDMQPNMQHGPPYVGAPNMHLHKETYADTGNPKVGRKLLQFNHHGDRENFENHLVENNPNNVHMNQDVPPNDKIPGEGPPPNKVPPHNQNPPHFQGMHPQMPGYPGETLTKHGVPVDPIHGETLLTLHDALDLWIFNATLHGNSAIVTESEQEEALNQAIPQDPHLREELKNSDHSTSNLHMTQFVKGYGPCPTLLNCVGHQACLFRFSNEFCQQDPYPGYRKVLNIQISCQSDSSFGALLRSYSMTKSLPTNHVSLNEEVVRNWPKETNFIYYKSLIEKGSRSYNDTKLVPKRISEELVFDLQCPNLTEAWNRG